MGEMDIVERLLDPEYAGCMQHLRSYDEIDRLFNASADLIESLRSENERLGNLAKSLSAILDAPDRAEAIIDVLADRDSWRGQCEQRDDELARIAKERDDAMKALEPFADVVEKAETAAAHFGVRHVEEVDDSLPYSHMDVTWGDLRRAAAISRMGETP